MADSFLKFLMLAEVEWTQLLRVVPDVGEYALPFLDSPGSVPERAEIRPDGGYAVENAFPATLDCGQAHEQGTCC